MLKFTKSSLPYKEGVKIESLQLDNQAHLRKADIGQCAIIETGAIARNATKTINLSYYETALKLASLWVSVPSENDESLNFTINLVTGTATTHVATLYLDKTQIPYTFPYFSLTPNHQIVIKANCALTNCFIFLEPNFILDHYKLV